MSVDWSDIHRLNPGSHMELQTAYRIKAVAFNRWNGELDPTTCIHAGCTATAPTSPSHWFWQCSAARRAWSLFLAPWERLHGRPWGELQQSVFRFSLDRLPVHAVELLVPATLPTRDRHAQLDVGLEVVQHPDPNTSGDAPTTKGSPLATPLPSGAQTGIRSRRHLMETPPQGVQQDGRRGGERRHGRQSIDTMLSTRATHRRGPHSQFSNRRRQPLVKQNRLLLNPVRTGNWKVGFRAPSAPRDHMIV